MSVDSKDAEDALAFLRRTGKDVLPLATQARLKSHMLKHVEGLIVKGMANQGVPISIQKEYARADERFVQISQEEAEAYGEWMSIQESHDTARIAITLYMSMVKDRS